MKSRKTSRKSRRRRKRKSMSLKMPNFPLKVGEVVNEKITKKNDIIKVEENNT